MAGVLYDSSVYIDELRFDDSVILSSRSQMIGNVRVPVHLSSVVLAELYTGASNPIAHKFISKLESDFDKSNRLIVPNKSDWILTGKILSKIGTKYGFEKIGRSRMTNDCLIAVSAARSGLTLLTRNVKDFKIISEFRPFQFDQI